MKVQILDDSKIVLYLYNYFFQSNEKEIIVQEVKQIFLKLIKYYRLNIGGVYNVLIYENQKYGTILEIEKTSELLFNPDLIDIKVKILRDTKFYFKTQDYFVLKAYKNIYYANSNYYIDIEDLDNLLDVLEFGSIEYAKDNFLQSKKIFIQ